jgi:uncharacterized membrane protein
LSDMKEIQQSIDVDVPVREVYDQWTQFESFPQFMQEVESVRQVDDSHLHWVASVGGRRQEWDAEIAEQVPDQRISWHSTDGDQNAGAVDFLRLGEDRTRVTLTMGVEPEGAVETIGTAVGITGAMVKSDLERFKDFIEKRDVASGGWRGEIEGGQTVRDDPMSSSETRF